MTISPFQISEAAHLYTRLSKLKPSAILEDRETSAPQDVVSISTEGKKKQIMDQTRNEVLQQIRNTK